MSVPKPVQTEQLCREVASISQEIGEFLKAEQTKLSEKDIEFKGANDLVSYVDKTSERRFVDALSKLLPHAGFIAEEGTSDRRNEFYNWVIDPLDGTTNYVHGIPMYCTSVALLYKEHPILGVIYDPTHNHCFYAFQGGGAWLNGEPINVSNNLALSDSLVVMGFPYDTKGKLDAYLQIVKEVTLGSRGLRRLGSAALDLAYVACGKFDLFFEYGLQPWDVAAGVLLVQEAGGRITDFVGQNEFLFGREIIAGGISTQPQLLKIVQRYWDR